MKNSIFFLLICAAFVSCTKENVLPKHLDEKVARLHLAKIDVELDELTNEQSAYLGIPKEGPFKAEHYRY